MTELLNAKQETKGADLPSKFSNDIDYLNGKDGGWVEAEKSEQSPGINYISRSDLDRFDSALPGNASSARAIPNLTIVDNTASAAPIGRTANTLSTTDFGRNDTGAGAIAGADALINTGTKIEQYNLISHNPERMELSTDIINHILIGGKAEAYKEQIADLSGHDRFYLAQDLHAAASEYNQLRGLTPGVDRDALIVDIRVGKEYAFVNDIDIMRGFSSQEEPERVMERVDLYDPGFWTLLKKEGIEADKKQALNAITAPYERISELNKERKIAYWNTKNLDNPNDRKQREEEIENAWSKAEITMKEDHFDESEPDKYEELKANLEANSKSPDSGILTENTRPLYPESARIARNELRPSSRAEEAISSMEKWIGHYQKSQ